MTKSIKITIGYGCTIVVPADGVGFNLLSQLTSAQLVDEKHSADYRTTYLVPSKAKLGIEIGEFEILDEATYTELRAKQDAEAEAAKAQTEAANAIEAEKFYETEIIEAN